MSEYKETVFLKNWIAGVKLAGPSLFGDGLDPDSAGSKWDLRPRLGDIDRQIAEMSCGEALFLASTVCFYNDEAGAALLREIFGHPEFGVGYIAASMNEDRRRVIADLFASYPGW